ncbi:MAG: hypothetical protein AUF65_01685 [Chloroflexi bacterium 13_1_20CM_50_12]|nr:MAG: hypothetical protein AUF65_01685 [Chloroflexi bacterium 13_1_20CM_50_12]
MDPENQTPLTDLLGPAAKHSEYRPGDTIRWRDLSTGSIMSGEVIQALPVGRVSVSGPVLPLRYFVDAGTGFPECVYHQEVIQQS